MHSRILILICIVCAFASASCSGGSDDWKSVLKTELRRCHSVDGAAFCLPWSSGGRIFVSVPPEVAKILEGRPDEELIPYLSDLRKHVNDPTENLVLHFWIRIASERVHGEPNTVGIGTAPQMKQIPVVAYSLRL